MIVRQRQCEWQEDKRAAQQDRALEVGLNKQYPVTKHPTFHCC